MKILVVGAEYGLGKIVSRVVCRHHSVIASHFDVRDAVAIVQFLDLYNGFDGVIYCAGINRIAQFDESKETDFVESMDVNCYGFIRLLKLMRKRKKCNLGMRFCVVTSNAANIPMRHSLAYNCSKAAANMAIKQIAREIHPDELMIFGVAPNKLAGTPMSLEIENKVCEMRGWTHEEARQYQIDALPSRQETDPESLAVFICELMKGVYFPFIHGNILPFGGPV